MDQVKKGVGIVVVAHSRPLAEELIKFASIMKSFDFPLVNAAGVDKESSDYGTNALLIQEAIGQADTGNGVLVFADIGSAIMSVQLAIETMESKTDAQLVDCPLVEGVVAAVAANHEGAQLLDVKKAALEANDYHKV